MDSNKEHYEHDIYKHCDDKDSDALAWAFVNRDKIVKFPFKFPELDAEEIRANVLYTGICQSDSHKVRGKWGVPIYPITPGHEIIAEVAQVGSSVKDFKVGEKVAFGTIRNFCENCKLCKKGLEYACNGLPYPEKATYGKYWGGYATQIQCPAKCFFKLPENLDLAKAAPLLCAGITVYSPIKHHAIKGDRCAVIGVGGLGHLAIMFLSKLGYDVTGVTTSDDKVDLIKSLGATSVLNINNQEEFKKHQGQYNFILNTTPVGGATFENYLSLCDHQARFVQVGAPDLTQLLTMQFFTLIMKEIRLIGSAVGSFADINEMLRLCAKENIYPMCEEFSFEKLPEAFDRLENGRPKFRCVVNVGDK